MAEAANVSQNSEFEDALLEMLIDKVGGENQPNIEDCRKIIQEWTQLMRQAIAEGGKEFEEVLDEARVAGKENELRIIKRDIQEINQDLKELGGIYKMKVEERDLLLRAIEALTRQIQIASRHKNELMRLLNMCKERYEANLGGESLTDSDLSQSFGLTDESNTSSGVNDQSVFSQISTGSQETPESTGFRSPQVQETSSSSDSTGVSTTFDIGTGLNVTTTLQGSPENFQQVSTVDSAAPGLETPRMINAPFNLNQTARISNKTPFIHKSRFGYTDPRAVALNKVPGFDYVGDSVKKTLILSSPERQSPLKVDINVQPHPLTQTRSGEHFVCDISLNMEETEDSSIAETPETTHWYKAPPLTEAVDRRHHGIFTPRGVFKRGHVSRRDLFGSDFESPDSPFGTGRKFHEVEHIDEYSPISRNLDREFDDTMEWEIPQQPSAQLNKTFTTQHDGATSPQLNKTFPLTRDDLNQTVTLSRSSTPSPHLNQAFLPSSKSPSPLNKTFTPEKWYPHLKRTSSPQSRSPQLIRKFSPQRRSPQLNRIFSPQRRSPQLNRTFSHQRRSPQLNRTYPLQIRSPQLNRTYPLQRRSPKLNRTFSPPRRSPQLNRTITLPGRASPQLNRALQSPSLSPGEQVWLDRTHSPNMFPPHLSPSPPQGPRFRFGSPGQDLFNPFDRPDLLEQFINPDGPRRRFGSPEHDWLNQVQEPEVFEQYFDPDEGLGESIDSSGIFDGQDMPDPASPGQNFDLEW